MIANLFDRVYSHPFFTAAAKAKIAGAHLPFEFRRGDVFLQAGKMANEFFILETGLVRAFVHDYEGKEVTTEFFCMGELVIEVSSLFQRVPSKENIVAASDGKGWKMDIETLQQLFHSVDGLWEWGRAWMSNQLFRQKERSINMITLSATDRYQQLLRQKPQVLRDAPLKQVASYLGITDTSLSRIRKEILPH